MLSGLGPKPLLDYHNIPVYSDLPVGSNLQFHFALPIFVATDRFRTPQSKPFDGLDATYRYLMHREGPLADTGLHSLVGFINGFEFPEAHPNLAIYHHFFRRKDAVLVDFMEKMAFHPDTIK